MSVKQPNMLPIPPDGTYELKETYTYFWEAKGTRWKMIVPKGYISDGASTPRLAWTIFGIIPDGLIRLAALLHDFLYDHSGKLPKGSCMCVNQGIWVDCSGKTWKRKEADQFFANIMKEAGVSKFKRRIAYLAVRLGGWTGWKM